VVARLRARQTRGRDNLWVRVFGHLVEAFNTELAPDEDAPRDRSVQGFSGDTKKGWNGKDRTAYSKESSGSTYHYFRFACSQRLVLCCSPWLDET